ncbi:protein-glutamate O-methyltransferase CheR [Tumebacillus sp. ITR2]|uniref:Protein-glutamate O-methyltransferase CheR n=1 Tax=Tumebacillus amylolyticus TaxID=2801339 RepID=A0ABS1JBC5_9BACL|nr:protein-glutamate O-methyltransferase CheR [Tumebacillus amylolyticus]MBL0387579.1 protein-glutamate O-methyltransferase CheR [Tumebacillus amylolyticus]
MEEFDDVRRDAHDFLEIGEVERIEMQLLMEGIYRLHGFDFKNYSLPFLNRRIQHRMRAEKLHSISALQDKVLHDPKVMERMLNDFSVNVTEMFRDPSFFRAFRQRVVPILREYPYIRIWHAGCSTGEEVYSMAILLHEVGLYQKARLYATDMNEKSLQRAERGEFPLQRMQLYTKNYLNAGGSKAFSEYYSAIHETVAFHPFLRENIVFAQHNLVTDRSFNEFHVIVCRNVMIYFDQSLQNRVHGLFYDSLSDGGILALGSREGLALTKLAVHYEEVDPAEKLYRKIK